MKFFLDSAIVDEIKYALEYFDIDGITTNPHHIQVSGKPFLTAIEEIATLVEGTSKTVSVEVNPHFTTYEEIITEARKLAAISPNFVIKLQCMGSSLKAIPVLAGGGIRVKLYTRILRRPGIIRHAGRRFLCFAIHRLERKQR